jgi:D-glycero-alpha-D-manno-heptose 1-phosphate guanylyltransferase
VTGSSITPSNISVVVLAGGQGTRIRSLHPDVPKPMIEVAGRPFLYWITAYLSHFHLRDFIYSAGYLAEQIEAWSRNSEFPGLLRRVCVEDAPLGTGGGLLNCIDLCDDIILVVNGDSLCLGGVAELLQTGADTNVAAGLIGIYQNDAARYGSLDFDPTGGRLRAFREKALGQGHVNAGVYLFRKRALEGFQRDAALSIEHGILPSMIARGEEVRVVALEQAAFIDIGVPETALAASAFIEANRHLF